MNTVAPAAIRKVVKELKRLAENKIEGVAVLPGDEDLTEIHAVIDGPAETPFHGGKFRVKLKLGPEFPQAPPKGTFLTKIFHPNVSNKGEICVNTLKKDWKPTMGIADVLLTIKCLLLVPNAESALNEEAGRLLLERYEDYCKHARLMTSVHAMPRGAANKKETAAAAAAAAEAGEEDAPNAGPPSAAQPQRQDSSTTKLTNKENSSNWPDKSADQATAAASKGSAAAPAPAAAAAKKKAAPKKRSIKRL